MRAVRRSRRERRAAAVTYAANAGTSNGTALGQDTPIIAERMVLHDPHPLRFPEGNPACPRFPSRDLYCEDFSDRKKIYPLPWERVFVAGELFTIEIRNMSGK
jgi:hypothetical protein